MYMPMNKLGLSSDDRMEARMIRTVDKDDPYFKSVSTSRIEAHGVQNTQEIKSKSETPTGKYICLADCDELLSTGLCYYDEGEAARRSPSWFAILNPMDIERWKSAANLFKENPPSGIWSEYSDLVSSHSTDWPPLSLHSNPGLEVWTLFVCAGFVYGGLHALPWNTSFRTSHEQMLWRALLSMIIGFGPFALLCSCATIIGRSARRSRQQASLDDSSGKIEKESFHSRLLRRLGIFIYFVGFLVTVVFYGIARVFVVVECFIALFHSAPGVFVEPAWSTYFPHIT